MLRCLFGAFVAIFRLVLTFSPRVGFNRSTPHSNLDLITPKFSIVAAASNVASTPAAKNKDPIVIQFAIVACIVSMMEHTAELCEIIRDAEQWWHTRTGRLSG